MPGLRFEDLFAWKRSHCELIPDVLQDSVTDDWPQTFITLKAQLNAVWDFGRRALHCESRHNGGHSRLVATLKMALRHIKLAYNATMALQRLYVAHIKPVPASELEAALLRMQIAHNADMVLKHLYSAHTAFTSVITSFPLGENNDCVSWTETSLIALTEAIVLLQRVRHTLLNPQQPDIAEYHETKIAHRMLNVLRGALLFPDVSGQQNTSEPVLARILIGAACATRLLSRFTPKKYRALAALTALTRYAILLAQAQTEDLLISNHKSLLHTSVVSLITDALADNVLAFAYSSLEPGNSSQNTCGTSKKWGTLPLIQFGILECATLLENAQNIWKRLGKTGTIASGTTSSTEDRLMRSSIDHALEKLRPHIYGALRLVYHSAKNHYDIFDISACEDKSFARDLTGHLKALSLDAAKIAADLDQIMVPREMFDSLERIVTASERIQDRMDCSRALYSHNWSVESSLPAFLGEIPRDRTLVTTCYSSATQALLCHCQLFDTRHIANNYFVRFIQNAAVKAYNKVLQSVGFDEHSPGDYEFRHGVSTRLTELLITSSSASGLKRQLVQGVIEELKSGSAEYPTLPC